MTPPAMQTYPLEESHLGIEKGSQLLCSNSWKEASPNIVGYIPTLKAESLMKVTLAVKLEYR